jgi:hypothetical protein
LILPSQTTSKKSATFFFWKIIIKKKRLYEFYVKSKQKAER